MGRGTPSNPTQALPWRVGGGRGKDGGVGPCVSQAAAAKKKESMSREKWWFINTIAHVCVFVYVGV